MEYFELLTPKFWVYVSYLILFAIIIHQAYRILEERRKYEENEINFELENSASESMISQRNKQNKRLKKELKKSRELENATHKNLRVHLKLNKLLQFQLDNKPLFEVGVFVSNTKKITKVEPVIPNLMDVIDNTFQDFIKACSNKEKIDTANYNLFKPYYQYTLVDKVTNITSLVKENELLQQQIKNPTFSISNLPDEEEQ